MLPRRRFDGYMFVDDYSRTRTLRGSFEDERLHLLDDFICSNVTKLRQGGCWAVKVEAVGLSIVKYTLQRRNEGERARGARGVYFGNTSVITARDASDPSSVVVKPPLFTVARSRCVKLFPARLATSRASRSRNSSPRLLPPVVDRLRTRLPRLAFGVLRHLVIHRFARLGLLNPRRARR